MSVFSLLWGWITGHATVISAVTSAIATIFIAWFTSVAVYVSREQSATVRAQLRAYVHVQGAKLSRHPKGLTGWIAEIEVKNFGQTPAYNTIIKVEKKIGQTEAEGTLFEFSKSALTHAESTLAPNSVTTLTVDFSNEVPADWRGLHHEGKKGYLWGRIDYVDAFNRAQFTTFQMVHNFGGIEQFSYTRMGNGTEFRLSNSPKVARR